MHSLSTTSARTARPRARGVVIARPERTNERIMGDKRHQRESGNLRQITTNCLWCQIKTFQTRRKLRGSGMQSPSQTYPNPNANSNPSPPTRNPNPHRNDPNPSSNPTTEGFSLSANEEWPMHQRPSVELALDLPVDMTCLGLGLGLGLGFG